MGINHFEEERRLAYRLKTPVALEAYEKSIIGQQVRRLRKKAGLTQKELAIKLKTAQSVVARIETGKQNLSVSTLTKLAIILGRKLVIKLL